MKVKIVRILFLVIIFIAFTKLYSMAAIHSTDPTASTDSIVSITLVSTEEVDNYNVSIKDSGGLSFQGISSNPGAIINGSMVGYMSLTDKVSTLATYTFKTPSTPGRYIVKFDINGTANNSIVTVTGKENESSQAQNNDNNQSNEESSNQENTQQQSNEQEQAQSQETPVQQEPAPQTEEPQTPVETNKSSNANLSNLGIRPNDFKGFKPGTLDYSVNVPNDVEKINVYATAQDKNAKIVSGTGSQNLNVGNNAIKVVVKAEDGTEKTYTINVTREEKKEEEAQPANEVAEETTTENAEENQGKSDLVKLEIEGQKFTPSFSADVYEYKLNVSKDVESLNVITEGANENINIEVAGNKEIKEGENLITILVFNNETKQNSTYQIIVNKASAEATGTENVNPILNSTIKKAKRNRYIVIGIGVFILVGIIVFIIVKNRNQDEDDEEYDEDEDNNETNHDEKINLSEEEGLFRRVNREDFKLESKTSQKSINNENREKIISKANFEKNQNDLEDMDIKRKGKHF